jgi:hypothetical protein
LERILEYFLEHRTMERVQKLGNSVCYTLRQTPLESTNIGKAGLVLHYGIQSYITATLSTSGLKWTLFRHQYD